MIDRDEIVGSRSWRRGVVGGIAAALGLAQPGTEIGGVAWCVAFVVACSGFGIAIERATRQRRSEGLSVAVGFSAMLLGSLVIARVGLLTGPVQLAIVGAGIAAVLLPRRGKAAGPVPRAAAAFAVVMGIAVLAVALIRLDPAIGDGVNHVFVVKRLWDTGRLGVLHHQLGIQLIGESYAALTRGADAVGAFELGVCPGLVLGLLATEIAGRCDRYAATLFIFTALPIALQPDLAQWSGVVLSLAAFWSLAPAIAERRTAWHTIIAALGLIALRHEYAIIGVLYVAAAVALPRGIGLTRRAVAVAIACWLALLIGVGIPLGVRPGTAVIDAVLLLAAIPVTALVLRLSGSFRWHSPFAVLWFGTITLALALALEAVRPAQHIAPAGAAMWLAANLATIAAIEPPAAQPGPRRAQLGVFGSAIAAAAFVVAAILGPAYDGDLHARVVQRFYNAVVMLRDRRELAEVARTSAYVPALQERVSPGARIGFWGRSAAQLDFRRNPIRDLSWPASSDRRRDKYYLVPLQRANLSAADYLIIESLAPNAEPDPWGTSVGPATEDVAPYLEPLASSGAMQLYRVKR